MIYEAISLAEVVAVGWWYGWQFISLLFAFLSENISAVMLEMKINIPVLSVADRNIFILERRSVDDLGGDSLSLLIRFWGLWIKEAVLVLVWFWLLFHFGMLIGFVSESIKL